MMKVYGIATASAFLFFGACQQAPAPSLDLGQISKTDAAMSFFVTSAGPGDGANLGGLAGADAHCTQLAEATGASGKIWRAYLSTTGKNSVNAKDRIGRGPWYNANGVEVAANVTELLADAPRLAGSP